MIMSPVWTNEEGLQFDMKYMSFSHITETIQRITEDDLFGCNYIQGRPDFVWIYHLSKELIRRRNILLTDKP
jgi:hypothetical protein